jgi:hypothetical protein
MKDLHQIPKTRPLMIQPQHVYYAVFILSSVPNFKINKFSFTFILVNMALKAASNYPGIDSDHRQQRFV